MDWKEILRQNARAMEDLPPGLRSDGNECRAAKRVLGQFPMSVTRYYLSLIDADDPDDPIRKMAIPSAAEANLAGSFDTSGEADNTVIPGMQHKYAETVLILSTSECAMYCRHCFRKRLVGVTDDEVARNLGAMRAYIREHTEISNVMLSGGDALMNGNKRLEALLALAANIPHVDTVRVCSRTPVVFPQRITGDEGLPVLLDRYNRKKQLHFVTQFNHPRELTAEAKEAVGLIQRLGIPVKNQAVLLRGVNDDAEVLGGLLRGLTRIGVAPYYVFQCRPVSGVRTQFQVPLLEGVRIVQQARDMQSGLGKTFRYCMSTKPGKLEILGLAGEEELAMQFHEAADKNDLGRFLTRKVEPGQTWLDE